MSSADRLHLRDVEDRQRLVVVEAPRQRQAVVRVVDQLLIQRVRDAEAAAAVDLRDQAARVDDRADVADAEEVDELHDAGLDVDFHFGEAGDERIGVAVARIDVLRDAHQAEADVSAGGRVFVTAWMSAGSSWPSNLPPSAIARVAACA